MSKCYITQPENTLPAWLNRDVNNIYLSRKLSRIRRDTHFYTLFRNASEWLFKGKYILEQHLADLRARQVNMSMYDSCLYHQWTKLLSVNNQMEKCFILHFKGACVEYIFVKVQFAPPTRITSPIAKDRLQFTKSSFTFCWKEIILSGKHGCTDAFIVQKSSYILLCCKVKIKLSKD
jgi:hypothetical protein